MFRENLGKKYDFTVIVEAHEKFLSQITNDNMEKSMVMVSLFNSIIVNPKLTTYSVTNKADSYKGTN